MELLLIEDSELDIRLFREYISFSRQTFYITVAGSLTEAINVSADNQFDIVVMDLGLPDSQGFSTFTDYYKLYHTAPIIILSCKDDEELSIKAVKAGAQDWICKADLDRKLLLRSIEYSMERSRIEEQLREKERVYKELIENSPDLICRLSPGMDIIYANSKIVRMFGIKFDRSACVYYANSNAFLEDPVFINAFNEAVSLSMNVSKEASLITSTGTRTFSIRLIPEKNAEQGISSYLCIMQDISDKKMNEYEKQMLQAQLHQSQKMEAIGQLAGGIAHDFNNMLAGIIGNAEILNSEICADGELNEFVLNIISISENASELTRQLLDFSRKNKCEYNVLDVHKIINDSVNILRNTLDRNIHIETELNASHSNSELDESHIKNALINLGVNARDAMPNGGKLIFRTMNITMNEPYAEGHMSSVIPGEYLCISVLDTGCGIPEDMRRKIFEPFFTTKERGKGTGLGLASVYSCMQNHKGYVDLYSKEGLGTEFKLYLPVTRNEKNLKSEQPAEIINKRKYSILLIDDETMIREISAKLLKKLGYIVYSFSDLTQSMEFYRMKHNSIDAVMLDLIMPEKSGEEVLHDIRSINPDAKVVICSGFSFNERINKIREKGAAGFVNKPFKVIDLQSTLHAVLEQ